MIKTAWKYSQETEALRLLHIAHNVANGFYASNHFIVLPLSSTTKDNVVFLPDLPYLSIPRFWEQAARIDIKTSPTIGLNYPQDLFDQTLKLLASSQTKTYDYTKLQNLWHKHQDQIVQAIYALIPSKKDWIKGIEIWPTHFGTKCSFSLLKKPGTIQIWLRSDATLTNIVEALLTALTRWDVYDNLNGLWSESELLVDWLLSYSPLAPILRKISPLPTLTIKATRTHQDATLVQQSQAFLNRLGAPRITPHQIDVSQFSPREKQIWNLLVTRSPKIVTFDEIADLLFKLNPESYSEYAITKAMQRLRDKLESCGISGSFIQTRRGEGYMLTY